MDDARRERTIIEKLNALEGLSDLGELKNDDTAKIATALGLIAIELAGIGDSLEHWRTKAERGIEYQVEAMVSS